MCLRTSTSINQQTLSRTYYFAKQLRLPTLEPTILNRTANLNKHSISLLFQNLQCIEIKYDFNVNSI